MTFPRYYDVLFKGKADEVLNVGFKLHSGNIKYYEQKKMGLSYCYSANSEKEFSLASRLYTRVHSYSSAVV